MAGVFSRWAGVWAWGEGKSVASLFVGLTGAYVCMEGGKNDDQYIKSTCREKCKIH